MNHLYYFLNVFTSNIIKYYINKLSSLIKRKIYVVVLELKAQEFFLKRVAAFFLLKCYVD